MQMKKLDAEPVVMSFLIGTVANVLLLIGFDIDPATTLTIAAGIYGVLAIVARRFVTPVITILRDGGWFDEDIDDV